MRTTLIVLTATGVLLAGTTASAQEIEHKANTRGLYVNGHLNGTSARYSDPSTTESGGGGGFQVGYGLNRNFTVLFGIDASRLSFGSKSIEDPGNFRIDFEDKYWLKQFEFGGRYNFVAPSRTWVPFLEAAYLLPAGGSKFTYHDLSGGTEGPGVQGDFTLKKGSAFSVGGGLTYFFAQKLALEASAKYAPVKFKQIEIKGPNGSDTQAAETKFNMTRVNFGVTWYPLLGR